MPRGLAAKQKHPIVNGRPETPSMRKDNYGAAKGIEITAAQGANIVRIESAQASTLEAAGWFKRKPNGMFDLVEFIHGYRDYQAELKRRGEERRATPNRVNEARAVEIELRTARDANELLEMERGIAMAQSMAGLTRSLFGALPARVTRDLELRREIEKACDDACNQIADKLAAEIRALVSGDDRYPENSEDDIAPGMGESLPDLSERRSDPGAA